MRLAPRGSAPARAGFTLLESIVALTIFAMLGYGLTVVVGLGHHSQRTVANMSAEDRSLRAATTAMIDELRVSSDSTITVTPLADGNHQVRFMQPIDVAGVATWGVYDKMLSTNPANQTHANWHVQYSVKDVPAGNGTVDKELVRQVLDDTDTVRLEKVLAEGLRTGAQNPPGFNMVKAGLVWQITLSTVGKVEGKAGIREVFHVRTRN
jgi:prepilin-type N-terminal cleavage/methylation domain-containing protein